MLTSQCSINKGEAISARGRRETALIGIVDIRSPCRPYPTCKFHKCHVFA